MSLLLNYIKSMTGVMRNIPIHRGFTIQIKYDANSRAYEIH
jgi:hypothetical protein